MKAFPVYSLVYSKLRVISASATPSAAEPSSTLIPRIPLGAYTSTASQRSRRYNDILDLFAIDLRISLVQITLPTSKMSRPSRSTWSSLTLVLFAVLALFSFLPVGIRADEAKNENEYGTVIGIDLGTTYSCVA